MATFEVRRLAGDAFVFAVVAYSDPAYSADGGTIFASAEDNRSVGSFDAERGHPLKRVTFSLQFSGIYHAKYWETPHGRLAAYVEYGATLCAEGLPDRSGETVHLFDERAEAYSTATYLETIVASGGDVVARRRRDLESGGGSP